MTSGFCKDYATQDSEVYEPCWETMKQEFLKLERTAGNDKSGSKALQKKILREACLFEREIRAVMSRGFVAFSDA